MKIGIDIFGGDFAPEATVKGSILAYKQISSDVKIVLIGDQEQIKTICKNEGFDVSVFEIVHTTEFIGMCEHPAKAYQQKPNSSIALGFEMLRTGEIDGFASAGSTGAMMVGAIYTIKVVEGVIRPTIAAFAPTGTSTPTLILDVGINPDARPEVLFQYGMLGYIYMKNVYGIENPRVGLLNIGEEEEKGNLVAKATYQLLKESKNINFVGNIEANLLFSPNCSDVLVCDGFVGNVVIKEAEAFYELIRQRKLKDEMFESFNYENIGGTPILGVNNVAVIGHGISNDIAIKNMILQTSNVVRAGIIEKIKEAFK
jgi:glycerol-3-phosphate acyltransferase PlsX